MSPATLNEQEVDALMDAIQGQDEGAPGEAEATGVYPYDLTSQDRIIRGQMPTLDSINERVASVFATRLSARVRLAIDVRTHPASMMKFSDFRALVGPAMTVALISLGNGHGSAVLLLEAGLAERLIGSALGDRQAQSAAVLPDEGRRDLTTVDRLVLGSLLSHFTGAMADAWAQVLPLAPKVRSFETDPRMVAIASPNDVVILCTFEISGAITGDVQLGIPFAVVEPVKKRLASPSPQEGGGSARFSRELVRALLETEVGVRVVLGHRAISLQELLRLEVGDVLTLDTSADALLPVTVEGRPKLWVRPHATPGGVVAVVVDEAEVARRIEREADARALRDAEIGTPAPSNPGAGSPAAPQRDGTPGQAHVAGDPGTDSGFDPSTHPGTETEEA